MEFILIKGNKSFGFRVSGFGFRVSGFGFWVLSLYKNGFGKLILKPFYV